VKYELTKQQVDAISFMAVRTANASRQDLEIAKSILDALAKAVTENVEVPVADNKKSN